MQHGRPALPGAQQLAGLEGQQPGRAVDENRAHQNHEPDGEDQHEPAGIFAQIAPDELRIGGRPVTQAHGPGEEIVHRARENAAEHHPEQGRGAVHRAQNGPEHRPQARDVQQLDEKNLVRGQGHAIHAVRPALHRSRPRTVNAENLFHKNAVHRVTQHQQAQRRKKADHPHPGRPAKYVENTIN